MKINHLTYFMTPNLNNTGIDTSVTLNKLKNFKEKNQILSVIKHHRLSDGL